MAGQSNFLQLGQILEKWLPLENAVAEAVKWRGPELCIRRGEEVFFPDGGPSFSIVSVAGTEADTAATRYCVSICEDLALFRKVAVPSASPRTLNDLFEFRKSKFLPVDENACFSGWFRTQSGEYSEVFIRKEIIRAALKKNNLNPSRCQLIFLRRLSGEFLPYAWQMSGKRFAAETFAVLQKVAGAATILAIGSAALFAFALYQKLGRDVDILTGELAVLTKQVATAREMARTLDSLSHDARALGGRIQKGTARLAAIEEIARRTDDSSHFTAVRFTGTNVILEGVGAKPEALLQELDKSASFNHSHFAAPLIKDAIGTRFSIRADLRSWEHLK